MEKIESAASVRNREPILKELQKIIKKEEKKNILEIGAGTGQHAVYMSGYFKNVIWQTSDKKENHEIIKLWINDSGLSNIRTLLDKKHKNSWWKYLCNKVDCKYTLIMY
jgi:tRNA G46 methylase TrmB